MEFAKVEVLAESMLVGDRHYTKGETVGLAGDRLATEIGLKRVRRVDGLPGRATGLLKRSGAVWVKFVVDQVCGNVQRHAGELVQMDAKEAAHRLAAKEVIEAEEPAVKSKATLAPDKQGSKRAAVAESAV